MLENEPLVLCLYPQALRKRDREREEGRKEGIKGRRNETPLGF